MSEWKSDSLQNLSLKVASGATPRGGSGVYKQQGITFIRSQNVLDYKFSIEGLVFIDNEQADCLRNVIVEDKDVLLNITGDSVARCCSAPKNLLPARVNQHVAIIRCNPKKLEPDFLKYSLIGAKEELLSLSEIGGTRKALTKGMIEALNINHPQLLEQKAIASVLSSLDDKIDLLHRQNKTLEAMAETLFRQWFIEEAEDDWLHGNLGTLLIPKKGKNITRAQVVSGKYPVVAGGIEPSCYHNSYNTHAPVITISASGANAGYVHLHFFNVWSSDSSFIDSSIYPYIYFAYMFLKINQSNLFDKQEGSAQPHIYPSHIMAIELLLPPEILIKNFEETVTPLFLKVKANIEQIQTLENLRDTLLPKLMSGEVRVKVDEKS